MTKKVKKELEERGVWRHIWPVSKRNYKAFAAELKATKPQLMEYSSSANYTIALNKWNEVAHAIAGVLAADNPRFDANRFFDAINS